MINPSKRSFDLYKGADFLIQFRLRVDGISIGDNEIRFKATIKPGVAPLFDFSSGDSPQTIEIDASDDNLITVRIEASDTADIDVGELYYEIDSVDGDGIVSRRMIGQIQVYEAADV